jgi:hypothetical protein
MRGREFRLANTELTLAAKFLAEHEALHGPNEVREGPRYTFTVYPDNIGRVVTISCATCKSKSNITDVDIW